MFTPVRTRRTFEEAAEQIAEKVRAGELRAGDKLPGERALAAQMEISRPTLREAIAVLVEAGRPALRPGPRGGGFVASPGRPGGRRRPPGPRVDDRHPRAHPGRRAFG